MKCWQNCFYSKRKKLLCNQNSMCTFQHRIYESVLFQTWNYFEGRLTQTIEVFWLGTFLNSPKSISALLETCHYLSLCIFVDLSYSALLACTSCQVVILPHLKRWKYKQCWIFSKMCPLEDFGGFGVVRVNAVVAELQESLLLWLFMLPMLMLLF